MVIALPKVVFRTWQTPVKKGVGVIEPLARKRTMDYMIFQGFIKLILYLAHVNCTAQSNQLLSNSKVTVIQTLPNLYLARLVTL